MEIRDTELSTPEEMKECIHLTKNSRGYNYELKIFPMPVKDVITGKIEFTLSETDIQRLEMLNNIMINKFGDKNGTE